MFIVYSDISGSCDRASLM